MGARYGVSVSHYGGTTWAIAELERELGRLGIGVMEIRGSAYPEMTRSEQVRQGRLSGVDTIVFVDSHVTTDRRQIEELVAIAERDGFAAASFVDSPWALECAAISRQLVEAMVEREERTYGNSAIDASWGQQMVKSVPLANPWNRNGSPLVPGAYLSDSQAFVERAVRAGGKATCHFPEGLRAERRRMRARVVNADRPVTSEPGSQFAVCVPSYGALDLDQQMLLFELEKAGMMVIGLHDCPWIDQARSWLAERALGAGRGCFFIDHDIIFSPNDVMRLCEQALERDGVVGAPYCMRRSGRNLIGAFDTPPGKLVFFSGGETLPAFYTGLGFAAVPAKVLEEMELPYLTSEGLMQGLGFGHRVRPWFALDCSTGFYAGEDVSFCNRVQDLAVAMQPSEPGQEPLWGMSHSGRPARVFLDSRVRVGHRGAYDYHIEDCGIVVPRFDSLDAHAVQTRKEARDVLMSAAELPLEIQLAAREFPVEDVPPLPSAADAALSMGA